jgi:hypothetical protein
LHRVQLPIASKSLDGGYRRVLGFNGESKTGVVRFTVYEHGARAAVTGATAFFRAGKAQVFAEEVEKPHLRLNNSLHPYTVYR